MYTSLSSKMRIVIPKYQSAFSSEASYTVYCVEVIHNGKVINLQKRYSEFYDLHKKLQKVLNIKFAFPPKRVLNKDKNLLEMRREMLELFLQAVLNEVQMDIPNILLEFLQLSSDKDFSKDLQIGTEKQRSYTNHQQMICFKKHAYLHESVCEIAEEKILSCIITKGCLNGIYN
ncbi:sorting nexin-24 isoform X1 [Hydra vulgaris]|uniref:Sorting nexin-24 n=1 Tax=Hydra vulgaris TaxID=6087 RepID=T2M2S5_HYDVU|nr:sorting nexin-24 [Hydra vulgaris]